MEYDYEDYYDEVEKDIESNTISTAVRQKKERPELLRSPHLNSVRGRDRGGGAAGRASPLTALVRKVRRGLGRLGNLTRRGMVNLLTHLSKILNGRV